MIITLAILVFVASGAVATWLANPVRVELFCNGLVGKAVSRCRTFLKLTEMCTYYLLSTLVSVTKSVLVAAQSFLRRHRLLIGIGSALLIAPVAFVLSRGPVMLEGYDVGHRRISADGDLIARLMQGERLVPPAPLPPSVFTAVEVEQTRQRISTADRSWARLNDQFVQRLLVVYRIMNERHGYSMALLEGYRSPERQASLSPLVTSAKAGQSYHQYGLAADSAFMRDGKLVITEKDPWAMKGYALFGQVAEEVGLTWGGRWKLADYGHVEHRVPGAIPRGLR